MLSNDQYESLLRKIVDNLVYQKSKVKIRSVSDSENGVDIFVNSWQDHGMIIGTGGKTIKALQSIFRSIGKRENQNVCIKAKDEGNKDWVPPVRLNGQIWSPEKTNDCVDVIKSTMTALGFPPTITPEEFHDTTLLEIKSKMPRTEFADLEWIMKMIFKHNGRKLAINWK